MAQVVWRQFGENLRIAIGVNFGRALAGTVGGGGRLDYTVIGDAVNIAARVESATRESGQVVLITAETRRRLTRDHGSSAPQGELTPKGKTAPVALFAATAAGIGRNSLARR